MKLYYFIPFLIYSLSFAQTGNDCSDAAVICGNQSYFASNEGATVSICSGCEDGGTSAGNFCFAPNNSIWLTFTTNEFGGDISLEFSNISCNTSAGYNTSIQAAIISATTPCDESTYTLVSNCESGSSSAFSLNSTNLTANTTYYVQIDGDSIAGNTNPAECGFNVLLSGEAVDVDIYAGEDTTINYNSTALLSGSGPTGAIWSPSGSVSDPSSPSTVTNPNSTTTFYYSYETDNGCVYSDDVVVIVRSELLVTNTFTPNDDGYNDTWSIRSIGNYPSANIDVYDRWGQRVYHSVGYGGDKVWDGTLLGARLPEGVYYYYIDLKTGNEEDVYAGYVTILH
ncbi:MAG: gliding motility-associated C-terminal domain-containing protein [Flavobacteriales bacterium]|nr:gliding motility-associated C-terminal domain-containing protein [Flavobacteriales bacterium]